MSGLHPEIRKAVDVLDQVLDDMGLSDIHSSGVAQARDFLVAISPPKKIWPPIHSIENRTVPGPGSEIPIRVYRPNDNRNLPVLVWFHGGGWVLGSFETSEYNCRTLANKVECAVVSVDYRLAPETLFPGAINDCSAATAWVALSADALGIDPRRVAVGGDSAGGNLAACVAYRARERGPSLVFQLLVYPVIDANFDRVSYIDNAQGYGLTRSAMQWYWDCYVPDTARRMEPNVSPIHATDLSGLPPALVITAEYDTLRDEGEIYGATLRSAGVAAETKRYDGVIHGFFNMPTEEPVNEVLAATSDAASALRQAFGTG